MTKILVTGGSGMVGSCIKEIVDDQNIWIFISSKQCDLTNQNEVDNLFKLKKPDYIIHLAADVGGLFKNLSNLSEVFKNNIRMNENVLEACNKYNVKRGIFCLSSCVYPDKPTKYPMNESMIYESSPHPSNEGYAYSKRMMEMQCRKYNEQFGREYICLIPVNLYGPYDNFNIKTGHSIPSMIHRFYISKKNNSSFERYGTGNALRQFLFSKDFAKIILKTLFEYKSLKPINCCDSESSISEVTDLICKYSNFNSKNIINIDAPDGCLRRTIDNSYFKDVFPNFKFTKLDDGLIETINWFKNNYEQCRK